MIIRNRNQFLTDSFSWVDHLIQMLAFETRKNYASNSLMCDWKNYFIVITTNINKLAYAWLLFYYILQFVIVKWL